MKITRCPALVGVFGMVVAACSGSGGGSPGAAGKAGGSGAGDVTGRGGGAGTAGTSGGATGAGEAGTSGGAGLDGTQAGGRGGSGGGTSGTAGVSGTAGTSSSGGALGGGGTCAPPQDVGGAGSGSCTPATPPSAKDSVTLDMAVAKGAPTYLGSGFIYGISEDGTQPPTALLSDIKAQAFRAGRGTSSQGCDQAAWDTRWKVIKGYYSKAKEMGVPLHMMLSDDYQYACPIPGDGGDWTTFTGFVSQLIASVKANGMTGPDVRWEIWNEADYSGFWKGTQAQWLDTWKHAYQQIRAAIPSAIIEGPSLASGPGGSAMNAFLDYVKTNDVVPDYISWHEAGGGGDPVGDVATINRGLSSRGITGVKGFSLNEYGSKTEQNPGHSAWFLARFDRAGIEGLRSNWAGGSQFFSNLGDLVVTNWQPNSQYWVYKRYADQTGLRTTVTAGTQVDAVAYQDACAVKSILVVGNKGGVTGAVNVVIKNIPAWLQRGGSTKVLVEKMPTGTAALTTPTVVTNAPVAVTCNAITVTLDWATATDGYVVTLTAP